MLTAMTDTGHLTYTCTGVNCNEEPHTHHVSHEEIQYRVSDPTMIDLPRCACGSQTSLKVIQPEWELQPPIISYAPDGSIASIEVMGATNKIKIHDHVERHLIPDDNGKTQEVFIRVIDSVEWPLPWIAHHQNLIGHMEAHGKAVPDLVTPKPEQMIPLSHVKSLVHGILAQHGITPLDDADKQPAIVPGTVATTPEQG